MIDFLGKISLRSKSACKIGKYLLIKLLIFDKMGLYDVTNLSEPVPKTLLLGFRALSRDIWETFWNCLATNDGEQFLAMR